MGRYSYKEVVYRHDFTETQKRWEAENGECDCDPGYDGHYWLIAEQLLSEKDAEVAKLKEALAAERARVAAAIREEQSNSCISDASFDLCNRLLRVVEGG